MPNRRHLRPSLRARVTPILRAAARRAGVEVIRRSDTPASVRQGYALVPREQFDIVRRDYYSPVPDVSSLPDDFWQRRSALGGVNFAVTTGMEFIEQRLAPFIAELDLSRDTDHVPGQFHLGNDAFDAVDAELLYGIIRAMRPARVIELGSGHSTLLINLACRRNASDGVATVHDAFDPYPRPHILGELPEPSRVNPISATDVPLEEFESLGEGDVLFVDSTHTVKLGSDVNFVVLDVLPRLRPGVLVHFHDVFLPWQYPRVWIEEMGYYWAEQYLVQAFLAYNTEFEVLVPAYALSRDHPERLARVIPSFREGVAPGSLWLRRAHPGTPPSSRS